MLLASVGPGCVNGWDRLLAAPGAGRATSPVQAPTWEARETRTGRGPAGFPGLSSSLPGGEGQGAEDGLAGVSRAPTANRLPAPAVVTASSELSDRFATILGRGWGRWSTLSRCTAGQGEDGPVALLSLADGPGIGG